MTFSVILRGLSAAAFSVALATTPSSAFFASPAASSLVERPVEVTARDVAMANEKIAAANKALVSMWSSDFRRIGERFSAPRVLRYTGSVMTSCGVIRPNNAQYCPRNNSILYDEVFVAGMAKIASRALGTDGDMAAVGIIAHEMGHAVAMQLGYQST